MNIEKYNLKSEQSFTNFEFVSIGTHGTIKKLIQFQETNEPNLYNLAFGDKVSESAEIDDLAVSNNGDTEKILATVVSALYVFYDYYPNAFVYATGSTKVRTRLYRMGITKHIEEINKDFYVYGQIGDDFPFFEKEKNYDGFLVQRKLT